MLTEAAADTPLLAYQVDEWYEGHSVVVFAKDNATARHLGELQLGEEAESCRRVPKFDIYAPGPVPSMALLESGWRYECAHCGAKVTLEDDDEEEDGEPMAPCVAGESVFCTPSCRARRLAYHRQREAAKNALIEWLGARYPEATPVHVHVFGDALERTNGGDADRSSVTFLLPGLQHPVTWRFGYDVLWVAPADEAAYRELHGKPKVATP